MNKTKLTNNETERNKLSVNNKRISNQKGITLIALVITIVILIILATVAINLIFGEDGLIARAEQAREMYTEGDEQETIALAIAAIKAKLEPIERDNLQEEIEALRGEDSVEITEVGENLLQVTFKASGNTYMVNKDGDLVDTELKLNSDYKVDYETNELYLMPYIENAEEIGSIFTTEEEMENYFNSLVEEMSQEQKEKMLLDFWNIMFELEPDAGITGPYDTIEDLLTGEGYSSIDELIQNDSFFEGSGITNLNEFIYFCGYRVVVIIENPDGSLNLAMAGEDSFMGYPVEAGETYTFKLRYMGIEIDKQITVSDTIANNKTNQGEEVTIFDNTIELADDFGNIVKVPGGFGIAEDSGTKVEEGIVIEDEQGNQFVWIPVGEYTATDFTSEEDPKPTITKTNNLARRSWGARDVETEPTEITEDGGDGVISSYYSGEGNENSCTNNGDGTNSIDAFKSSATENGGFYIGRYEAGTETERIYETDPLTTPLVQANKSAYVYVTRDQAKIQAEAMYKDKAEVNVTSQLISSYAWDTALNFICQNSEQGYLLAKTADGTYGNIGTGSSGKTLTGGYPADKYSNIYDLLGNCMEWNTEYSTYFMCSINRPCVLRGGQYNYSNQYAAYRGTSSMSAYGSNWSFRIQLYIGK